MRASSESSVGIGFSGSALVLTAPVMEFESEKFEVWEFNEDELF